MVPLDGIPGPLAMQPDVSATAALELRARSQEQALRQMAQHGNWWVHTCMHACGTMCPCPCMLISTDDPSFLRRPRRLAELAASATKLASYVMQELGSLRAWLGSCVDALPQIDWIPPGQAAWRTGLVLATSLLLIVVISTIDGVMLQLYLVGARRLA